VPVVLTASTVLVTNVVPEIAAEASEEIDSRPDEIKELTDWRAEDCCEAKEEREDATSAGTDMVVGT